MNEPPPAPPEHRRIALAFLARLRQGERPDVESFLARHPAEAPLLRPLLEALRSPRETPTDAVFEELFGRFTASEIAATLGGATSSESTRAEGTQAEAAEPGARFDGRYRVLRTLGRGGFGEVHLVEDELHPGEKLALKTIRVDRSADPHFEQRFRNEIRIMRALQHPGIPQIFNDGKTGDGEFFFTMAFLEGVTLEELLRGGKLPIERTIRLLRQMVSILAYAHARNVVHRDLKPPNVIVVGPGGADEQLKILDFGIAKVLRREGALQAAESMNTLGSPGTPAYMAPEQLLGEEVDARADVYALGVILHRMLAGELPFAGTTPETRLKARLTGTLPPLTKEQAPEWLAKLSARLLQPDRDQRPTLPEIEKSLEAQAFTMKPAGARPRSAARPRIIAGVVIAAGAAAVWFWPRTDGAKHRDDTNSAANGEHGTPNHEKDAAAPPKSPADSPSPAPASVVDPKSTPLTIGFDPIAGEATFDPKKPRLTKESSVVIAGRVTGLAGGATGVLTVDKRRVDVGDDGRFVATIPLTNEGKNEVLFQFQFEGAANDPTAVGTVVYVRDTKPPLVSLTSPANGERPTQDDGAELAGRVEDENLESLFVTSRRHPERQVVPCAIDGKFKTRVDLDVGENEIKLVATDRAGNESETLTRSLRRLGAAPTIRNLEPVDGAPISRDQKKIRVKFDTDQEIAKVQISGETIAAAGKSFDHEVEIPAGDAPTLKIQALDRDGQTSETKTVRLTPATLQTPAGFEAAAGAEAGALGYAKAIVHPASKLELVLVDPPPAGTVGAKVTKPFYVGRYEVTRQQYEEFCHKTNRKPPAPDTSIDGEKPDVPIVSISIEEAEDFCQSLARDGSTVRLPTTAEWEYAAGGPARTLYPWGSDWKHGNCNSGDEASEKEQRAVVQAFKKLVPVDAFRDDRSPCGACDLAGNVSEWCRDEKNAPTKRGGSFTTDAKGCRLGEKVGTVPSKALNIGFRVVVALDR